MANKIFHSSTVTFLDRTDERKLEVYISSNHPTVQIKNQNTNEYTPDWSTTNLQLSADVFIDSQEVTTNSQTTINWYTKTGNTETLIGTGSSLTVSTNVLANNPIITYVCKTAYQNVGALSQITFTRTDTGLNGTNGVDGTGVTILGSYDTLAALQAAHPTGSAGDAYIIGGRLYVWAADDAQWEDVGQIQGPAGKDGAPAKLLVLNGTSQVFKFGNGNSIPSPATITVTAQRINIPNTETLTWTYNGSTEKPSYVAIDTIDKDKRIITGKDMTANSLVIKVSDGNVEDVLTIYKAFDGTTGDNGDDAPIAFLTNENISFAANANGVINNIATLQVVTSVAAYIGTTKQMPTLGEIPDKPSDMNISIEDDSLLQEKKLTISFKSGATLGSLTSNSGTITIPVLTPVVTNLKLSWSKINTGISGAPGANGADAVTFQIYSSNGYALSTNTPTITLQTFAYVGNIAITAGATYQWYAYDAAGWTALSDETNAYLAITREEVTFSRSYMCKMTFNGVEYTSVATIDDKNDENKVFTSKPSNYSVGDLWIVGVDYIPGGVEVGTLLRAEHTNTAYEDEDWITATKYDEKIRELQSNIDTYNQYFSFDSTDGLRISARDANGKASQFSTSLTNERLSFNYGNESIAYINGTKMNIKEAEIESPLTVTGKYSGSTMLQAPVINIGNFSIIVESNGSLSIVANT